MFRVADDWTVKKPDPFARKSLPRLTGSRKALRLSPERLEGPGARERGGKRKEDFPLLPIVQAGTIGGPAPPPYGAGETGKIYQQIARIPAMKARAEKTDAISALSMVVMVGPPQDPDVIHSKTSIALSSISILR